VSTNYNCFAPSMHILFAHP